MKKSPRRLALVLSLAVGLLAGLLAAGFAAFALALRPPAGLAEEGLLFTVRAGEGAGILAARLEAEGAIRSALAFRLLAKARGDEGRLKAGVYRIEPAMGGREVLGAIVSGRQALVRLTVPEGATLSRVALILEEGGVAAAAEFRAAARDPALLSELGIPGPSLEGYLFPDAYTVAPDTTAVALVDSMLARFDATVTPAMRQAYGTLGLSLRDAVVLASIIEKEAVLDEEKPLMAAVLLNRLAAGMPLQADPTVQYALGYQAATGSWWKAPLTVEDLAVASPYNTYLAAGLPPGPISNPGLASLAAVANPAAVDYLFFVVDCAATTPGAHVFSVTYDEHLANVARCR